MMKKMKFDDFTFEVIDISITGTSEMHITQNGITFTRKLAEDMGYPQFVTPMIDVKNKVFAIKACKIDNEHAVRFSKPKGEQRGSIVTSSNTIRYMLRKIMGDQWENKNRYHIPGIWYADAKAMLFDLNAAKELLPFSRPGL